MSRSRKVRLLGILALALISMNLFWLQPFSSIWAQKTQNASLVQTTSSLPYNEYANGPNTVRIWALARIHPAERIGMLTRFDFHLARATGSIDNQPNCVHPLSIKVS